MLASMTLIDQLYADEFNVDLLTTSYTSGGAVIASHLDDMINQAGVTGFSQIKNATMAKILLRSRVGGIVETRVRNPQDYECVVGFDLNQVNTKTQFFYHHLILHSSIFYSFIRQHNIYTIIITESLAFTAR